MRDRRVCGGGRIGSWRRHGLAVTVAVGVFVAAFAGAAVAQPDQPPIEEFVPIDELPPEDRLPAAPFLVAAYSIVWILAFGYFWLLSRRFSEVERELADLSRRIGDDGDDG